MITGIPHKGLYLIIQQVEISRTLGTLYRTISLPKKTYLLELPKMRFKPSNF